VSLNTLCCLSVLQQYDWNGTVSGRLMEWSSFPETEEAFAKIEYVSAISLLFVWCYVHPAGHVLVCSVNVLRNVVQALRYFATAFFGLDYIYRWVKAGNGV
jgi:hypothetical protein